MIFIGNKSIKIKISTISSFTILHKKIIPVISKLRLKKIFASAHTFTKKFSHEILARLFIK